MKARTRAALTTLVLLAVAGVAVSVAWFGVHLNVAEEKARADASKKLFAALDPAKVTSISVTAKGTDVKLERDGTGWKIVSPVDVAADPDVVRRLLQGMAGLVRRATSAKPSTSAAELANYGLAAPAVRIAVTEQGGRTDRLALGATNGFDGSMFVMPTSGEVAVVAGDARPALAVDLDRLRDRRVLPVADGDVARIEVGAPKLSYVLAREGDGWRLEAPVKERADDEEAGRIASALAGLRATSVVDAPEADAAYGLDHPRFRIAVQGRTGPAQSIAVGEAPHASATDPLHARRAGESRVYEIPGDALAALDVDLATLRDRRVLRFDEKEVASIRFVTPEGAFEVRKGAAAASGSETWRIVAPKDAPAVSWKVSGLVWSLDDLEAHAFFDETGARAAAAGLASPRETVTLSDASGKELARLELGKDQGNDVLVRSSASPRILALDRTKLATLPRSVAELEETTAAK